MWPSPQAGSWTDVKLHRGTLIATRTSSINARVAHGGVGEKSRLFSDSARTHDGARAVDFSVLRNCRKTMFLRVLLHVSPAAGYQSLELVAVKCSSLLVAR